jgi:FkbM family methyltransferase
MALDRCSELLLPELGVDLRQVLYPPAVGSPPPASTPSARAPALDLQRMFGRQAEESDLHTRRLNQTHLTQPAIFVVEYALAELFQERGLRTHSMIGYSLGEYVAACLSGVLDLEDSLKLVARRAQLIERLPAGAMLAVPLPEEVLVQRLGAQLSLCAVNGSEFCVIGGPPEEVAALEQQLRAEGTVSRRVQSSYAFHTRHMEPIAAELTRLARTFRHRPPTVPYVSNVTGALITAAEATEPEYWAMHLCRPVRFADGLTALYAHGAQVFVELGPGQTLSSLALMHPRPPTAVAPIAVSALRPVYNRQPDIEVLATAIGKLQEVRCLTAAADERSGSADCAAHARLSKGPAVAWRAPETELELALAAIWQLLLRVEQVGLDDDFFQLGGNSLLATRALLRVQKALGVVLPLRLFYESPRLAALAAQIAMLQAAPGPAANEDQGTPPTAVAAPRQRYHVLPDGTEVRHQNEAETRHFYHDIFEQRSYVKHGLRIRDRACVFDVGANIGLFTLFASREARGVRIYSFEPAPPLFAILAANVERHRVDARLFPIGLSNEERVAHFTFYPNSSGMSSFHADLQEERDVLRALIRNQGQQATGAETGDRELLSQYSNELLEVRFATESHPCQLRRLSDVIRENRIERIDLLKIDVQKCEQEVLEGLTADDWPKVEQIAVEVHDIEGRVSSMQQLLRQRGYRVTAEQDPLYAGTNIYNLYAMSY